MWNQSKAASHQTPQQSTPTQCQAVSCDHTVLNDSPFNVAEFNERLLTLEYFILVFTLLSVGMLLPLVVHHVKVTSASQNHDVLITHADRCWVSQR